VSYLCGCPTCVPSSATALCGHSRRVLASTYPMSCERCLARGAIIVLFLCRCVVCAAPCGSYKDVDTENPVLLAGQLYSTREEQRERGGARARSPIGKLRAPRRGRLPSSLWRRGAAGAGGLHLVWIILDPVTSSSDVTLARPKGPCRHAHRSRSCAVRISGVKTLGNARACGRPPHQLLFSVRSTVPAPAGSVQHVRGERLRYVHAKCCSGGRWTGKGRSRAYPKTDAS